MAPNSTVRERHIQGSRRCPLTNIMPYRDNKLMMVVMVSICYTHFYGVFCRQRTDPRNEGLIRDRVCLWQRTRFISGLAAEKAQLLSIGQPLLIQVFSLGFLNN